MKGLRAPPDAFYTSWRSIAPRSNARSLNRLRIRSYRVALRLLRHAAAEEARHQGGSRWVSSVLPTVFATLGELPDGARVRGRQGPTSSVVRTLGRQLNAASSATPLDVPSGSSGRSRRPASTPTSPERCACGRPRRGLVDYKVCAVDETWSGLLSGDAGEGRRGRRGSWGTAFAWLLAEHGHETTLACRDPCRRRRLPPPGTTRATSRCAARSHHRDDDRGRASRGRRPRGRRRAEQRLRRGRPRAAG